MKDDISPEERLLRLIRAPKGRKITASLKQADSSENPIIDKKISNTLSGHPDFKVKHLTIFSIRNIIILIFTLALLYLIYSLFYSLVLVKKFKIPVINSSEDIPQEEKTREKKEILSLDFYSQGIENRQIFNIPAAVQENKVAAAAASESLKNLNLVGIIAGENPQAIIEDKKNQKTYYLQKGQFIEEYEISDIQEGKVILLNNAQKYELYL